MNLENRAEIIRHCLKLPDSYEDYPFRDNNFTVMRCRKNKRTFAMIYERNGHLNINVKCDPQWIHFWREAYPSVIPGYHMNKKHWNTIVLDGTVPECDVVRMIGESYDLAKM